MQIDSNSEDRMKVAIIGTSGAGKTCFIAAMRWLGECSADARFISVGANGDSKKYLDDLHEKVNVGEVPPGTPKEFKLEFSERYVYSDGKPPVQIDFSMRDFKGGVLHDLDTDSPLLQSWTQCDLLMVLLDIEKTQKPGVELQGNLRDLSSVLIRDEMNAAQKRLAIVITQADKGGFAEGQHSPEAAERLLNENLLDFFERIKTCGFKEIRCFLLASIGLEPEKGSDGKSRVPELEGKREWRPFGYEELFDWICMFRAKENAAKFIAWLWVKTKPGVAILAVLAIIGVIWCGVVFHGHTKAKSIYDDPNSTLEEKATATLKMQDKDRIDAIEDRIRFYNEEAEGLSEDTSLRELLSKNQTFFSMARISEEQSIRVSEIDHRIADKLERILFNQIKDAMERRDNVSARVLIGQYRIDRVITRSHLAEVDNYNNELDGDKRESEKREIAQYDIGEVGNTQRMYGKLNKIRDFNYPDQKDKDDALKAVEAMEKLMRGSFGITQINAEGLEKDRNTYVLIATGIAPTKDLKQYADDGEGIPVKTKEVDSKDPQWNGERLRDAELAWSPGQSIRVEWRRNPWCWTDKCIAYLTTMKDWIGLLRILQPQIEMKTDQSDFEPKITIKCKEFPDAVKDLELIERYVIPGTYWIEQ